MIELLSKPWPWYVVGPIITFVMFSLLLFGREFGVSSTLRAACSILGAGKVHPFFDFDWKSHVWNLVFILGALFGGFIAAYWFSNPDAIALNPKTVEHLEGLGINNAGMDYIPTSIFTWSSLLTSKGILLIVVGGFLVGFGSRYAGGCTSGHAISGLSNLQVPSLLAVIGFFIGGLIMTWGLLPYILRL